MRQHIVNLAMKFQGIPYIWGGSVPWIGFDCSGFVVWIMQVFGVLPAGDWSAASLYDRAERVEIPKPGALCFYGTNKVTHVMVYIGELQGIPYCVGASGGGSDTLSVERARERNAKVKMKPVHYRSDFIGYRDLMSQEAA